MPRKKILKATGYKKIAEKEDPLKRAVAFEIRRLDACIGNRATVDDFGLLIDQIAVLRGELAAMTRRVEELEKRFEFVAYPFVTHVPGSGKTRFYIGDPPPSTYGATGATTTLKECFDAAVRSS